MSLGNILNCFKGMIFINGRFLTRPITGVGRFALELCKAMKHLGVEFTVLVPRKYENFLVNNYELTIKYIGFGDSHFWEQFSLGYFMLKHYKDLLISFSGLGPVVCRNHIMTIHDLSFFYEPKWFSKAYYYFYSYFTPIVAKNSKHIFTVSNFSKSEIVKYLRLNPEKISVIYNGNSFVEASVYSNRNQGRFILGVSSLDPRKNHQVLISAFNEVREELDLDLDLILVGKGENHFNFGIQRGENDRIKFTGYITDEKLQWYYQNALLFVYPSLYEGFGIPPLEAIFFRCPVLISDIPVFKEIFDDTAVYFNPKSKEDLKSKIVSCLNSMDEGYLTDEKRDFILSRYDWNKSALKVIKIVYDESITNS